MKQMSNILIILAIIVVLIAAGVLYFAFKPTSIPNNSPASSSKQPQATSKSSSKEIKTYQSKKIKFSISFYRNFKIEENFNEVILNSNNGNVLIGRNGTNFPTIAGYVDDLSQKNHLKISQRTSLRIDGKDAVSGIISHADGIQEKTYFIYADNWVYTLSTSSEALYNDLDQIAESFKYTP